MATTGNEKVSRLVEITAAEVMPNDLFYVVDTSARESKKMQASQLAFYLNASGSLFAIHAINSDTASYVAGSNVFGVVASSSLANLALNAISSSWASSSLSSSHAITSSFSLISGNGNAETASFLKYQGFPNGTASFALTASLVINSLTASFIQYIGVPNGTASYAITSQNVDHATNADTASFFNSTIGSVASASIADTASFSFVSLQSNTSSFLLYSGFPNGTASFALSTGINGSMIANFGVFLAHTQSITSSILDDVNVSPSTPGLQPTVIDAVGTVIITYTSSIPVNESLTLKVKSRDTGIETILDATPVYFILSPTVGNWDSFDTGSLKMPFSLMGETSMSGEYQVFITASSGVIHIEPTRICRFNISSLSNALSVSPEVALQFLVIPTSSLIMFSSSLGGPFFDYLPGIYSTGSNNILEVNVSGSLLSAVKYVWTLISLRTLNVSNNITLTRLSGMPNSLQTMSCYSCSIGTISDLNNTTASYLYCSNNDLLVLPTLPLTMSVVDCSSNLLTSLPDSLPSGLKKLQAGSNAITSLPSQLISASSLTDLFLDNCSLQPFTPGPSFPNGIFTMSLAKNTSLTSYLSNLPLSMSWFDISSSPVGSLPGLPVSMSALYSVSCSFNSTAIDNICSDLVTNGILSGTLDIRSNVIPSPSALTNIGILQTSRDWIVLYDT